MKTPSEIETARGASYFRGRGLPLTAVRVRRTEGGRMTHPRDLTEREHVHDFRELVLVLRGGARHRLQGIDYPVRTGEVYILREESRHVFHDIESLDIVNVMYAPNRLPLPEERLRRMPGYCALFLLEPQYRRRHQRSSRLHLDPVSLRAARSLALRMVEAAEADAPGSEVELLALLLELMVFLSRRYGETDSAGGRELLRIGEVLGLLEETYRDPWTLAEMSRRAHMSRSTFLRVFRRTMGLAPGEYLIEKRLDHAQRLLLQTDRTVTDIALDSGFTDSNYFTRQFRARRGLTPTRFRSQAVDRASCSG